MGELTQAYLKEVLYYNQENGNFHWRNPAGTKTKPWAKAGAIESKGYISINLKKRFYKAHRLAWLYVHGSMPKNEIDHINHNVADNSIANLRDVTRGQNVENTRVHKDNVSGFKGVTFDKRRNNYFARIMHNKVCHHLGSYSSPELAAEAYKEAAKKLHSYNHVNKE